jgi:hypothetical protein
MALRPYITLVVGLLVGVAGAVLFLQSMPPKEGSAEERVDKLEVELKKANNRVAALEDADPQGRRRPGRTMKDGMRSIAENIRDGKPVTPDDVFRATQPLIRDLGPLFDRMRVRELQRQSDSKAGELARKYSLTASQQESLKQWLDQKAVDDAKHYTDLVSQEGTKLEDLARAAADVRVDDGLEKYMEATLSGDKLAAFKSNRMLEKVASVQQEADMNVTRLDGIVGLDDTQRSQVFGVMARSARDFDPAMQFEGLGTDTAALPSGNSKQDAILAVLKPAQRQAYEAERAKRREETRKEMEAIGLTLPDDSKMFDPLDY